MFPEFLDWLGAVLTNNPLKSNEERGDASWKVDVRGDERRRGRRGGGRGGRGIGRGGGGGGGGAGGGGGGGGR